MSITTGPNLGLMVNGNQGEGHYSQFMAFLRGVDGLVMPNVKGYLVNTPPASPASGDCYIIGAAPTGAWAGKGSYVTRWSTTGNTWEFYLPKNGWMLQANSARESYRYTGGAWEVFYQEGTWTPTLTGATIVGSPIFTGAFVKNGRFAYISALIQSVAGSTVASSGGNSTYYSNSPFTPSKDSSAHTVDSSGSVLGSGWTHASVPFINMPAFAANGNWISTSTSIYI